jgi:hypothetical protein
MNWIGMLIGGAMGLAFGLVFRCTGNACPITSNWWIPALIGAILGLTWRK